MQDYTDEKRLLGRILTVICVEPLFLRLSMERFEAKAACTGVEDNLHATKRHIQNSRQAPQGAPQE